MKDVIVKGARIKKEIIFWLVSFFIAVAVNIVGIIKYNTSWWELFSQLHIVIALSILIYFLLLIFRGIWSVIKKKYSQMSII